MRVHTILKKIQLIAGLWTVMLSGCGVQVVPMGTNPKENAEHEIIRTPDSESVVLTVADWSDSTKAQRERLNAAFEKDHPNVTVHYTTLTQSQFNETVAAGIRSGNAPDLFPLPSSMSLQQAVNEQWYLPLDLYLDQAFFSQLRPEAFQNNVTMIQDVTYILPESLEIPSVMMFYNEEIARKADPDFDSDVPMTWSGFMEICRKITELGDGEYYGMITSGSQTNRIDLETRALCGLNGVTLGPPEQIFLKDNKAQFTSPGVVETLQFYTALSEEGLLHPDSAGLSAPEARKLFEQGKAAFIVQGSWCIPTWKESNPDFQFGVTYLPEPDHKFGGTFAAPFTKGWMGISAQSEHPDIAAEYLRYLYSYEYQKALMAPGGFVSIRNDLGAEDIQDPIMQEYVSKAQKQSRIIADPLTEYAAMEQVYEVLEPVSPDFGSICSGILSGNYEYGKELEIYDRRLLDSLRRAVEMVSQYQDIRLEDFNV
ncbi:ABC transporter substrate-binding protein [Faecalibaculum rodentium]|nr:sugar ABC transporter substrate-binding protein [Faecalibaculum rodentium]